MLTWDGLGVRLNEQSSSWKLAIRAIQSAIVRAEAAIAARNAGDVVATPEVSPPTAPSPEGRKGLLASVVRDDWIAEKAKSTWVPKTKHEHAVWSQHFLDLVGDRPIGSYGKADGACVKPCYQR